MLRSFAPGPTGGLEMRPASAAEEHDMNRDAEAALALLGSLQRGKMTADVFAILVRASVSSGTTVL